MYHTRIPFYLCKLADWIASIYLPRLIRVPVLGLFSKITRINVKEAALPLSEYTTINQFFTRELHSDMREIDADPSHIVSPVDGRILEFGDIKKGTLIQAKGHHYCLSDLIPTQLSDHFLSGSFLCIYLSPSDCHRIFSPLPGHCIQTCHVPGALFPVREPHISQTPQLYTKNERLITILNTEKQKLAVVMVGAINVGKITVSYAPDFETNLTPNASVKTTNHFTPKFLNKGDHLGTFHLGSTVILCSQRKIGFNALKSGDMVQYGQSLGRI